MPTTNPRKYFITGIGTNIGKTIFSAIITEALEADYWKPIQSGDLDYTDTHKVKELISNKKTNFHPEVYSLKTPASPHASAKIDGVTISLEKLSLPSTKNHLIVEGAGGLMVPINDHDLIIDLVQNLNLEVILVSQNYLGSINHTLLSYALLQSKKIPVKGIIFNGESNKSTEDFILNYTQLPCLLRIQQEKIIDKIIVKKYAGQLKKTIK